MVKSLKWDSMNVTVVRPGFLTTVQDLGRTGFRQSGVSRSGALDPFAFGVANLLVGNDESNAGIEVTFGGLRLRFNDQRIIAWCGGEFDVRLGPTSVPAGHAGVIKASEELKIDRPKIGCRCWLAISGGIDLPIVLESRSTDLRANFGGFRGRALQDGDLIPLGKWRRSPALASLRRGRQTAATDRVFSWSAPALWSQTAHTNPTLRFIRGVDWDRFSDGAIQRFTNEPFTVSPDSDRMGVRLDGPELKRNDKNDLVSEAVAPGTIQVPPSGKPI
ncbi:MAG: biotin-dependent carboxyltransferase family protein, partial [Chthoniobacterales bacterium]